MKVKVRLIQAALVSVLALFGGHAYADNNAGGGTAGGAAGGQGGGAAGGGTGQGGAGGSGQGGGQGGAAGGGGTGGGTGGGQNQPQVVQITREELDRLIAAAAKGAGGGTGGGTGGSGSGGGTGDPLRDRVDAERQERERASADSKTIESALQFTMGLDDFVKKNSDLLPNEIGDIVRVANAERYDSAQAKANAVKVAVVGAYFNQAANLEALTEGQRREFDDYMKLTKNGREEKVSSIYANIFEPSLESNRRLKRAQELGRSQGGIHTTSGTEAAHRDKMIEASRAKWFPKK